MSKDNLNKDLIKGKFGRPEFAKGNKLATKENKAKAQAKPQAFSIKEDLIKELKSIKRKDKKLYKEIIASYWKADSAGMRQFLLEIIDGKARQSTEISGNLQNPVRILHITKEE
jgi:hypothetical protein